MGAKNLIDDVLALPPAERLALVHEVWQSLLSDPEGIPLTLEQQQELDRRYEDYLASPEDGESWEQVEAFVKGRLRA